jgi:PII-like signaling protein
MMLLLESIMPEFNPIPSDIASRGGRPPSDRPGLPEEAVLLRIFVGEDDHYKRLPLYEAIVLKAREMHLAGATVLRGFLGFGKSSHMHTAKVLRLSMDLPMVIEIADTREKVNAFLPYLEPMMGGGLVTLERAHVVRDKQGAASKRAAH